MRKGKHGQEDCGTRENKRMRRHRSLEKVTTFLRSTTTTWRNNCLLMKKRIQAFFISKFLKFYGEEFVKAPINSNTSSNTREKAICTATGSHNPKSTRLGAQ
jgi:hypothetical protein